MPSACNGTKPAAQKCPHCHGEIEQLGAGRGGRVIERCRTCGREPVELPRDAMAERAAPPAPRFNVPLTGKPCSVDGCPGTLDGSGQCACCAKRAAWAEAHLPKRKCEICEGPIRAYGTVKYCKACKPVANKASIANAPSTLAAKKK